MSLQTLINSGAVTATGTADAGADIEAGGGVTNNSGGTISGPGFGVFMTGAVGTVTNSSSITGADGVALELGGSVTNAAGGSISGAGYGVFIKSSPFAAVTNAGSIGASASAGAGVGLAGGGVLVNSGGGVISGPGFGVFVTGAAGTVANYGSLTGYHGIGLEAGGLVTNASGASISGGAGGIFSSGAPATIANAGKISATGAAGLDVEGGGTIANLAGASIIGSAFGVFLTGGPGTLTNAGSISGGSYSVKFSGGFNDQLIVDPGAVFVGAVGGSGGTDTLELASGSGSIGGINAGSFLNFQNLLVDGGGDWSLTGANSAATVTDTGTVALGGSLDVTSAINPSSTGLFQLNSGSSLTVAAALGTQLQMSFLGSSTLAVENTGSFGTGSGTSSYAGPLLEDFAAGDTIDLANFASAGAMLSYNQTPGVLQLSNGAAQLASLEFQNSSLGTGTFNIGSDSSGHGTVITLA